MILRDVDKRLSPLCVGMMDAVIGSGVSIFKISSSWTMFAVSLLLIQRILSFCETRPQSCPS